MGIQMVNPNKKRICLTLRERSSTQEHPLTQQIKFCPSIHLSLDALELIHLALRLPVAIFHGYNSSNCIKVAREACRQTLHLLGPADFGFL